jgi:choline-sulfatase
MRAVAMRRAVSCRAPFSRAGLAIAGLLLGGLVASGCGGHRARPNLLFITLDTTRADHLGSYGYPLARTAEIDRLAREGVRCTDAVTAVPITLPSHTTLFTGLLPPAHGVRDNGTFALSDDAVTLAERLKKVGYRTQAIVSALVLNRRYNLNQGFDGYDDDLWSEDRPALFLIRSRPGPKTAARAVGWLQSWSKEQPRRPFFLWMHLFDAHQPYSAPLAERLLSPTVYDAEIAVLDKSVGKVVAELRRQDVLDDTLVVVTADHGESLGEHGEKTHALFIYDATLRIPLILRYPRSLPAGKVYPGAVRSVDVAATVLATLGVPGGDQTQGQNLLPAFRGDAAPPDLPQYAESFLAQFDFGMAPLLGVRHRGAKWIRAPKPEIYDLEHDPRELHNLYPAQARRGAALDQELEAILKDSQRHALAPRKAAVDGETRRSLQALGYLAPVAEQQAMGGIDPKDGLPIHYRLERARHFAQHQRWPECEAVVREVLRESPRNTAAVGLLGLTLLRQGDLAGAREQYLRGLALDPKQAHLLVMLGSISMFEGNLDGAEREFKQAIDVNPGFVEAIANLGMLAALRDDDAAAEHWYRQAMAVDPSFPLAYRRLGDLHYERGDFRGALTLYEKTLAEQPDDYLATVQAGNSARRVGDAKLAQEFFLRAERDDPEAWVPRYNLACLKAIGGDPQGALDALAAIPSLPRPTLLENDKDLVDVRKLPGFAPLLHRFKATHRQQVRERRAAAREASPPDDSD